MGATQSTPNEPVGAANRNEANSSVGQNPCPQDIYDRTQPGYDRYNDRDYGRRGGYGR